MTLSPHRYRRAILATALGCTLAAVAAPTAGAVTVNPFMYGKGALPGPSAYRHVYLGSSAAGDTAIGGLLGLEAGLALMLAYRGVRLTQRRREIASV